MNLGGVMEGQGSSRRVCDLHGPFTGNGADTGGRRVGTRAGSWLTHGPRHDRYPGMYQWCRGGPLQGRSPLLSVHGSVVHHTTSSPTPVSPHPHP